MGHIHHEAQGVTCKLAQHDAIRHPSTLEADEADIELAARDRGDLLGREHFPQVQSHRRIARAISVQDIRQQIGEWQR